MRIIKKVFQLLKSSYGIFTYILIYVAVMVTIFAFQSSNTYDVTDLKYGTIAIIMNDNSKVAQDYKAYMSSHYKITDVVDPEFALKTAYISGYVEVNQDFEAKIKNNEPAVTIHQISETLPLKLNTNQFINAVKQNNTALLESRIPIKNISDSKTIGLSDFFRVLAMLIFGISGMFILSFIKPLLDKKTIEKVRLSNMSMTRYIVEMFVGMFVVMLFIITVVSIYGLTMFQASPTQLIWPIINAMIYYIISILALLLIFAITSNEDIVMIISNALGVFLVMISGAFFPIEMVPEPLLSIAKLIPTYYYVALVPGFELNYFLIQMAFIAVLALATINAFKFNKNR